MSTAETTLVKAVPPVNVMISPELMVWVMAPSLISKLEKPPAGVDQVLSPLKKVAALGVPVADKSINASGPTLATGLINNQ